MLSYLSPSGNGLWVNVLIFAVCAVAVWLAGTRLARYADALADRTGVGKAFLGLILLGGITSLPEIAATATAATLGDAPLAVNNLLGGVAMQVAILAIADAMLCRENLSSTAGTTTIMLQGTLNVLMLILVSAGIAVGEPTGWAVGVWSTSLLPAYLLALWMVHSSQNEPAWVPEDDPRLMARTTEGEPRGEADEGAGTERQETEISLRAAVIGITMTAVVILGAGYLLASTADVLADQTGIGSSVMGAVFLAIATSLPEVSTVVEAVRLQEYEMAFSDIFGTNLIDVALVLLCDVLYTGPPVLNEVGSFSLVAALLGMAVTTVYLVGLIERKDRHVLRLGIDSAVVLVLYGGGIAVLWTLR